MGDTTYTRRFRSQCSFFVYLFFSSPFQPLSWILLEEMLLGSPAARATRGAASRLMESCSLGGSIVCKEGQFQQEPTDRGKFELMAGSESGSNGTESQSQSCVQL
jgi:hypothetical protein